METNENLIAEIYEKSIDESIKKSMGKYYTPNFIINYILKQTIGSLDVVEKPFVKIIDPACGVGYFLLSAYDLLKMKFTCNIDRLKQKYRSEKYIIITDGEEKVVSGYDYWRQENIHYHILTHCIYGADQDRLATDITVNALRKKSDYLYKGDTNVVVCDSLIFWEELNEKEIKALGEDSPTKKLVEFWTNKYDCVIGNPPYIGHKSLSLEYKKWLLSEYSDVFKDKSDISFCFFKRIKSILTDDGVCGIISSRYFMESPTGSNLRKYLVENINIMEIVDFGGRNIFKDVGVATAIYIFKLKANTDEYYIDIHKLSDDKICEKEKISKDKELNLNIFDNFKFPSKRLGLDRWTIIPQETYNIYKKIEDKCQVKLRDIALSFQGIITGCDKAFILDYNELVEKKIEMDIVKPWIKSKHIKKYKIKRENLYLIYSNNIKYEIDYPNSIDHISKYKDKLKSRREYKNGIRKWYQLQWGRKEELFDGEKIVFPYKSKSNQFSIDYNKLYFSADVYGLIIKEDYREKISLEYLVGILNSKTYEFYFKLFAKKMGKGVYDYYPNSILDLSIVLKDIVIPVERISKKLINDKGKEDDFKMEIDDILMDYFEFTSSERQKIKKTVVIKEHFTEKDSNI